jgi:hypothetical protein
LGGITAPSIGRRTRLSKGNKMSKHKAAAEQFRFFMPDEKSVSKPRKVHRARMELRHALTIQPSVTLEFDLDYVEALAR